jgi:hypothetical protein
MATPRAEPSYEPNTPGESHLWDHVHVRRQRTVVAVFAAIVALATLRTLLTKPVYEATADLLIEKQNPNVLNIQGVTEERAGTAIDDYNQTQYKLLQSRNLARRVIERLNRLNDPECGGPPEKTQIEAILAQPAGQSPQLEGAISAFLAHVFPDTQARCLEVMYAPAVDGRRRQRGSCDGQPAGDGHRVARPELDSVQVREPESPASGSRSRSI